MSKQRARDRAARQAASAAAAEQAEVERQLAVRRRARRERRALVWRRVRLWQHSSRFRRDRDRWAGLLTLVLVVILCAVLFTGSIGAALFVVLVVVVACPALVMIFFDRSRR